MYPSDYGYATLGGTYTKRDICLNTDLHKWDQLNDCYQNNWLYHSGKLVWTLTPEAGGSDTFYVGSEGYVRIYPYESDAQHSYEIFPTI